MSESFKIALPIDCQIPQDVIDRFPPCGRCSGCTGTPTIITPQPRGCELSWDKASDFWWNAAHAHTASCGTTIAQCEDPDLLSFDDRFPSTSTS